MADNTSFLGKGWAFPPSFVKGIDTVEMVSEEEDVQQSLGILLGTFPGERVLRPTFGANLERLLFEPLDTTLKAYMKDIIKDAILYNEPRVVLDNIDLLPNPNEGFIEISVELTIKSTNTRSNIVFPFYLNEAVNV